MGQRALQNTQNVSHFRENQGQGVRNALFGTRIGNVEKTVNEVAEGRTLVFVGPGHNESP